MHSILGNYTHIRILIVLGNASIPGHVEISVL